ncbi:MAG: phosphate ABC transporter substrate-binding protein PstS family protein [Spirulinaceae cyanobacterium]
MKSQRRPFTLFAALTVVAAALTIVISCTGDRTPADPPAERIQVDGSSTVSAITSEMSTAFAEYRQATDQEAAPVTVGISGTGGGFEKFCVENGTDISDASRAIKTEEQEQCAAAGVEFMEIRVAIDALTVAVNRESELEEISFAQLQEIWRSDSPIRTWQDLDTNLPDDPIEFFRPGDDSGTFDYFAEAVLEYNDQEYTVRQTDDTNRVTPSEDDNTLVEGIESNSSAIGFFGFAYYKNNSDRVQSLKIAQEAGDTAYAPSEENVNAGNYLLARPLFIYVNQAAYESRPEIRDFVAFYLALLMVDAGGDPLDVSVSSAIEPSIEAIVDFLADDSESKAAQLVREGEFLSTIGYVSKPVAEYATELGNL